MLEEKKMREDVAKCFNKECCPDCPRDCVSRNDCFRGEKEMKSKAERLAAKHWEYVGSVLELQYKTAFIHGYKHGRESVEEKVPPSSVWEGGDAEHAWEANAELRKTEIQLVYNAMKAGRKLEEDGDQTIYETSTGRFLTDEKAMED